MTLVEAGYACAPIATLVGGVLLGRLTKRCRHDPDPDPAPAETLVLPRIPAAKECRCGAPDYDTAYCPLHGELRNEPARVEPQWVPRRRPSPRPRRRAYPPPPPLSPYPPPPPPNGRYAPGRAPAPREEWR